MRITLNIKEIKNNPNNPRFIRDEKFKKLVKSLQDFPEMLEVRPVVINMENIIIGGNMRYRAMKEAGWTEVPVDQVDWSEDKQREFMAKDNISVGEWDFDMLANEWDKDYLEAMGLDMPESKIDELEDGEEIEFEQSVQIEPPQEYIIILADPNSIEWEEMKEKLKLNMVRRGGYKKGSAFDAVSIERVIKWNDFKERYK